MAQISLENLARRSETSLKRTNSTPGMTGSKGSRYFSLWVVATEPMVRPWKSCSRARNFVPMLRPVERSMPAWARASLRAASQASVPLLHRKTRSRPLISVRAEGEFGGVFVEEEIRGVDEASALTVDRFFDGGMGVAERGDADAAEEIEVVVAILVAEVDTLSADEEDWVALVGLEKEFALRCLDGC